MKRIISSRLHRRVRAAVSLLLVLVMMVSALPLTVSAADPKDQLKSIMKDRKLYKWEQVLSAYDLPQTADKWYPILISYTYKKTVDDKEETYECFLNMSGASQNSKTGFWNNYNYAASSWDVQVSKWGYPSLADPNVQYFWTLDNTISDIGVRFLSDTDAEKRKLPVHMIGRNIDWNNAQNENAAKELLVNYDASNVDFCTTDSQYYKDAQKHRPNSFRSWSFVTHNYSIQNDPFPYNVGVPDGMARIESIYESGHDSSWYWDEGRLCFGYFSKLNYGYEFTVWIGKQYNLPTLQQNFTVQSGSVLNIDNDMLIQSGATLTIAPGATVTVDADLYNNGTIINYGTLFLLEGSCIRSLEERKGSSRVQNNGKIICSGSPDGVTATGEGNLVMFKNSTIIFDENPGLFVIKDGASVETNGTIFCPNTFELMDADFHIRESGRVVSQYKANGSFFRPSAYRNYDKKIPGLISWDYDLKPTSMNLSQVSVPFMMFGLCSYVNEGEHTKQTEPSEAFPGMTKADRQALADKYLKSSVWQQDLFADRTHGDHEYAEGTDFYNDLANYTVPGLNYKMYRNNYDDTNKIYWNHIVQFNTQPGETGAVSGQNPKTYKGELVEYVASRSIAAYMLDSSGWYTTRNLKEDKDPGAWKTLNTGSWALLDMVTDSLQYQSFRREYSSSDFKTVIREGHYDYASDTFITYDYQQNVKYIEYRDGRVQVYMFTGSRGNEVQGLMLGEKTGKPVDLRTNFDGRSCNVEKLSLPVWTESVIDYARALAQANGKFFNDGASVGDSWYDDWTKKEYNALTFREKRLGALDPTVTDEKAYATKFNTGKYKRIDDSKPAAGQNPNTFRGELVRWPYDMKWSNRLSEYRPASPYEAYYMLDGSGWYTVRNIDAGSVTVPAWSSVHDYFGAKESSYFEGGKTTIKYQSYRRLWSDDGATLYKEGHYEPKTDTFVTYDYRSKIKYVEWPSGMVEAYSFTGNWGSEKQGAFIGRKVGTVYVDLRDNF